MAKSIDTGAPGEEPRENRSGSLPKPSSSNTHSSSRFASGMATPSDVIQILLREEKWVKYLIWRMKISKINTTRSVSDIYQSMFKSALRAKKILRMELRKHEVPAYAYTIARNKAYRRAGNEAREREAIKKIAFEHSNKSSNVFKSDTTQAVAEKILEYARTEYGDDFANALYLWANNKITQEQAAKQAGLTRNEFASKLKRLRQFLQKHDLDPASMEGKSYKQH